MFSGTEVSITSTPAASMFRRTAARRAAYLLSAEGEMASLSVRCRCPMDFPPAFRRWTESEAQISETGKETPGPLPMRFPQHFAECPMPVEYAPAGRRNRCRSSVGSSSVPHS